jgi:thiazole tautomerase (transcriptional regulator TenI)
LIELHAISTGRQSAERLIEFASHIHPYVDAIHIREKHRPANEIFGIIEKMVAEGVPLRKIIVNDRVDVAFSTGAGGVQLAHHSLDVRTVRRTFPDLMIGRSIHSVKEALNAKQEGANYLIYGHVFATQSKAGLAPRGLQALSEICKTTDLPVIAIGGIQPENIRCVSETGAGGIAVMSGIFEAEDPLNAAQAYRFRCKDND